MRDDETRPIFVKIDEYRDVLDIMNVIKKKLVEANDTLKKINELKNKEEAELDGWRQMLDEVGRKVNGIDKLIFEPGV